MRAELFTQDQFGHVSVDEVDVEQHPSGITICAGVPRIRGLGLSFGDAVTVVDGRITAWEPLSDFTTVEVRFVPTDGDDMIAAIRCAELQERTTAALAEALPATRSVDGYRVLGAMKLEATFYLPQLVRHIIEDAGNLTLYMAAVGAFNRGALKVEIDEDYGLNATSKILDPDTARRML